MWEVWIPNSFALALVDSWDLHHEIVACHHLGYDSSPKIYWGLNLKLLTYNKCHIDNNVSILSESLQRTSKDHQKLLPHRWHYPCALVPSTLLQFAPHQASLTWHHPRSNPILELQRNTLECMIDLPRLNYVRHQIHLNIFDEHVCIF